MFEFLKKKMPGNNGYYTTEQLRQESTNNCIVYEFGRKRKVYRATDRWIVIWDDGQMELFRFNAKCIAKFHITDIMNVEIIGEESIYIAGDILIFDVKSIANATKNKYMVKALLTVKRLGVFELVYYKHEISCYLYPLLNTMGAVIEEVG